MTQHYVGHFKIVEDQDKLAYVISFLSGKELISVNYEDADYMAKVFCALSDALSDMDLKRRAHKQEAMT